MLHLIALEGQTVCYSLRDDTQIANNTYEQVLQCLENHFADKVNVVSERYSFGCRIQKSGESIDEVVVALRRLAQKCDFGAFLNTSLRDQLIKGVREIRVRDRLLQDNPSLEECLKIAKRIEAGIATSVLLKNTNCTDTAHSNTHTVQRFNSKFSQQKSKFTAKIIHSCFRCGSKLHFANSKDCPAADKKCKNCNKTGHFAKVCRSASSNVVVTNTLGENSSTPVTLTVNSPFNSIFPEFFKYSLQLDNKNVVFVVGSGAKASIISKDTFDKLFPNKKCIKNYSKITGYGGSAIDAHGISNFETMSGSLSFRQDFYVAHGISLIGLDILDKLHFAISINDTQLNRVHTCIPETSPGSILKQKFQKLFDSDTLGHAKNFVLSSAIDATITPVISKARPFPFAMKDHVEKEDKKNFVHWVFLNPVTMPISIGLVLMLFHGEKMEKFGFAVTCEK